ncbi:hypothetical protein Tco_0277447 [Tanacetum coccineum]
MMFEKAELKACLEIVPKDDEAVNSDGRVGIGGEGREEERWKIFSAMLDDFDRQDVLDLYRLVKERFETTSPEGYDRFLWGDLITLFKPIHLLLMDTGITIYMLVEKKYPLTQEMLSRMLNRRLEVDHECEMAYELLRFTRSQLKNTVYLSSLYGERVEMDGHNVLEKDEIFRKESERARTHTIPLSKNFFRLVVVVLMAALAPEFVLGLAPLLSQLNYSLGLLDPTRVWEDH